MVKQTGEMLFPEKLGAGLRPAGVVSFQTEVREVS